MAQVYPQIGARSNGLGTTGLCFNDVWSVYNNPGAFGAMEENGVGVSYENRFLLKELSTQSLAFGYHTEKAGNIGIHFQQYGFSLYREMIGGVTYGMKLFRNFSAGVQINYHRIALGENYGSKNSLSAGLGMFYQLNKSVDLGVRITNISRSRLAEFEDERLPTVFGLGMMYTFSEKVLWTLEAEKTVIHPINFKSGLELKPHEILALRIGMNSYPFQSSFGVGLKLKKFSFDLATLWHSNLGISPSAGLKVNF
ncbi:MAG: hypothetical protein MI810_19275 [Flavobacteriales bacterium]|nr:hypothetical protein [Flavobacteriales bacterium]